MTGQIFISYRKTDDPGFAGRLYDHLANAFSAEQIFMDVASIKPGKDYVKELQRQVADCDVLLAIIGRGWENATNEAGQLRLHKDDDWVRVEIETAIRLGKLTIPILVNSAPLPEKSKLPSILHPLLDRQSMRLSHDTFRYDVAAIASGISEAIKESERLRAKEDSARNAQADKLKAWTPLTKDQIDLRVQSGTVPAVGVRLISRQSAFPQQLGRRDAVYAFCGDYEEYRGRFLRDIMRDAWDHSNKQDEYLALKFRIDPKNLALYGMIPATADAMYHAVTDFSKLDREPQPQIPSEPNEVCLRRFKLLASAPPSHDLLYRGIRYAPAAGMPSMQDNLEGAGYPTNKDFHALYQKVGRHEFLMEAFGIQDHYQGSGRGGSEFSARHLLVRNLPLNRLEFDVQQMGHTDDLIILA